MSLLKHFKNAMSYLRIINKPTTAALLLGIHQVAFAQSIGGLSRAQTTLQTLRDNLDVILPIAAIIIGVIIFVLYSAEVMRKDDAIRWGIGVLLAGSVAELVVLLWK
ncbi:TrbC/VirB2 family protein [Bordetella petrii]|uniref:Conjugal transfer protein TrwL n=1 Tax=Bordetella petrii (strain ATCC BAA-461 / DSM 12804 / CCUG 43448 / CIP 107267 / Se-1111R) TaxID=340100 RepID=A9I2D1_BORPD|nr:TrbC/VirB2 family protein [Bordetella petrii]CAP44046.1 conjugal transfer protein TrwL [Bordetella petrii]